MKTALYIRIPNNNYGKFDLQKENLIYYVNEKNWTIEAMYIDTTSETAKQKSFQDMLNDIAEKKFDVIITTDISRLSRNVAYLYELGEFCKQHNVHIISTDNEINTIRDGYQILHLYIQYTEEEKRMVSNKVKEGIKKKKEKSIHNQLKQEM